MGGRITSGGLVAAGPALQEGLLLSQVFPAHLATEESQCGVWRCAGSEKLFRRPVIMKYILLDKLIGMYLVAAGPALRDIP